MTKGVIWDMDGVLADTAQLHYQAWKEIFKEKGINISWDDFARLFGMRNDKIIPEILGKKHTEEEITRIADEKELLFRKFAKGNAKPFDSLVDLLSALKEDGFKMAVASSGTYENVELITTECKLKSFFSAIVRGNEVKHSKPNPEIFTFASKKMGVPPAKCIVVEDSLAGVEGAKKAGMGCIAITSTHKRDSLKGADLIVDSYKNLSAEDFNKLINPAT